MNEPPLKPRSFLFTLYGDYVHPLSGDHAPVHALVRLAADLGVSSAAVRTALSRMGKEGWVAVDRGEGRPRYRLSGRGRALIDEGVRRIYGRRQGGWDGRWLVVSYSLPERRRKQRARLRSALSFLGFGSLGNGVYVSPHDLRPQVAALLRDEAVEADVTVHYGDLEWPRDASQLVSRAWDLSDLARRYSAFEAATRHALRESRPRVARSTLPDREAFRRRFRLTHEFRRFPFSDPDLPEPLLPAGWVGESARAAFEEYNRLLKPGAERYYLAVASGDGVAD